MKNKKVLHIITVSYVINHFFGNQFNYMKKLTGNKYFLGCSPSDEFFKLSEKLNYISFPVEVTRNISPFTDISAIFSIFKFIKKNKIDVVVGHTPKGGMVAMIAAYFAGVENRIYFRHGIIYETRSGFQRYLLKNIDRLSGNLATKVVCVSNCVKSISVKDHLNNPEKNVVLGLGTCSGIDTERNYNPALQDENIIKNLKTTFQIRDTDFVVGYVGRLVKDKGINELIAAWKILEKSQTNIKLLLVGPIENRNKISIESLEEIQKNPNIINTGFVLNSAPYFSLFDVFVLPTFREGFPTVSLEASSMEIPVIITRATGCEESIIENKTGLFIENSAKSIAEKIEIYLNDRNLKTLHGKNGREFVRTNFEETKVWNEIHDKLEY
ncbi:glycosyltransferase family 4 protein [Halpernia sp.]|uniref:glycosyltransferase family 4 protein n=1 Tax=Halpernia sp. TaxID=2782209 RepID=UPI003A8E0B7D